MNVMSKIIEGLNRNRVNESYGNVFIMSGNEFKFSDDCTRRLENKYLKSLESLGAEYIQVDVSSTDDDVNHLDDVVSTISIGVIFRDDVRVDVKKYIKEIDKVMKIYPDFNKFDRGTNQLYFEITDPDDIEDVMASLEKDGCPVKRFCRIMSPNEVESHKEEIENEQKEDRRYQEREWYRSKM